MSYIPTLSSAFFALSYFFLLNQYYKTFFWLIYAKIGVTLVKVYKNFCQYGCHLKTTKKFYRIGRIWLQLELVLCLFTNLTFLKCNAWRWRYYNEQNDTQHNNKILTLNIQHYHVKCRYFECPFMLSVTFIYCYVVYHHAECRGTSCITD